MSIQNSPVVGYAAGAFDLFHVGHLNLLRQAKMRCDFLIAGVVSDEILLDTKGRTPVISLRERLDIVQSIGIVDRAIVESNLNKLDTWKEHKFDVFFKGDDWKGTEKAAVLEREFSQVGVKIVYFPYTVHTSSTILRRALDAIVSDKDKQDTTSSWG